MVDQAKVGYCKYGSTTLWNYSSITGILLFNESNLQHAVYWYKDKPEEDQQTFLRQFQEVWRHAHHIYQTSKVSYNTTINGSPWLTIMESVGGRWF